MLQITMFICAVIFAVSVAQCSGASLFLVSKETEIEQEFFDPKNPRLYHLGAIDGKSFFAHTMTNGVSWEAGRSYCISAGLKIAKIESAAQQQFLQSKYHVTNFHGCVWVGGRDARDPSQFVWDKDNSAVTSSGLTFGWIIEPLTCMYYVTIPENPAHGRFEATLCSRLNCPVSNGVLCET